jgi:excisionase family DNA binding protein
MISGDNGGLGARRRELADRLGDGHALGADGQVVYEGRIVHKTCQLPVRGDPYVVSVPDAAVILGISKDLAYDLARRGELPGAFQLGRRWRVSLVKLQAAVHGTEHRPAEHAG